MIPNSLIAAGAIFAGLRCLSKKAKTFVNAREKQNIQDFFNLLTDNLEEITELDDKTIQNFINDIQNGEKNTELPKIYQIQIIFEKVDLNTVNQKIIILWIDSQHPKQRVITLPTDLDSLSSEIRSEFILHNKNKIAFIFYDRK